jgi:transcription elongation factor Elf1
MNLMEEMRSNSGLEDLSEGLGFLKKRSEKKEIARSKEARDALKFKTKDKNGKCVYCNSKHRVLIGVNKDYSKRYINCPECDEGKKLTAMEKLGSKT